MLIIKNDKNNVNMIKGYIHSYDVREKDEIISTKGMAIIIVTSIILTSLLFTLM